MMTDYEYAEKQTALLKDIPEELRGGMVYLACERGHAYGNDEIFSELTDIVSNLQEPIKKVEERIRRNTIEYPSQDTVKITRKFP